MRTKLKISIMTILPLVVFSLALGAWAVTNLFVSLSPNTPLGGYILLNGNTNGIPFSTFNFQVNGNYNINGTTIIKKLTVKNYGSSANINGTFNNFYLYQGNNLIAPARRFNSTRATFNNLNIAVTSSTELTIRGDLGYGATPGQSISIGIDNQDSIRAYSLYGSSTTSTLIYGIFPIIGNIFRLL